MAVLLPLPLGEGGGEGVGLGGSLISGRASAIAVALTPTLSQREREQGRTQSIDRISSVDRTCPNRGITYFIDMRCGSSSGALQASSAMYS
jgi:hypothetical protein